MVAITLDGLKYANVKLDLVRSNRRLFLKFGRNTLLSYATRLTKNSGREFISCAVKCRTLIFCVLRVTLRDYHADPFKTPTAANESTSRSDMRNLKMSSLLM